jgi:hypothetical protein
VISTSILKTGGRARYRRFSPRDSARHRARRAASYRASDLVRWHDPAQPLRVALMPIPDTKATCEIEPLKPCPCSKSIGAHTTGRWLSMLARIRDANEWEFLKRWARQLEKLCTARLGPAADTECGVPRKGLLNLVGKPHLWGILVYAEMNDFSPLWICFHSGDYAQHTIMLTR